MQYKSVKKILDPLLKGGREWQYIDINGEIIKPKYFFSDIQWIILLICLLLNLKLSSGLSKEMVGYIMSAFAISVSLFMSLLVSIFDKFENTDLNTLNKTEDEIIRLVQKKNFFKRFISITSYLVILSITIILLCSLNYIFTLTQPLRISDLTITLHEISATQTIVSIMLIIYRTTLNYLLLNYLLLTLFITSSAYEYYISEIDRRKIK